VAVVDGGTLARQARWPRSVRVASLLESARGCRSRKVRTPQSRALDNVQAAKADGQRNRKQTANGPFGGAGKGETVR